MKEQIALEIGTVDYTTTQDGTAIVVVSFKPLLLFPEGAKKLLARVTNEHVLLLQEPAEEQSDVEIQAR